MSGGDRSSFDRCTRSYRSETLAMSFVVVLLCFRAPASRSVENNNLDRFKLRTWPSPRRFVKWRAAHLQASRAQVGKNGSCTSSKKVSLRDIHMLCVQQEKKKKKRNVWRTREKTSEQIESVGTE